MSFANIRYKYKQIELDGGETVGLRAMNDRDLAYLIDEFKDDVDDIICLMLDENGEFDTRGIVDNAAWAGEKTVTIIPRFLNEVILICSEDAETRDFDKLMKARNGLACLPLSTRYDLAVSILKMTQEAESGLGKLLQAGDALTNGFVSRKIIPAIENLERDFAG